MGPLSSPMHKQHEAKSQREENRFLTEANAANRVRKGERHRSKSAKRQSKREQLKHRAPKGFETLNHSNSLNRCCY
jgi:hypothetical protein